MYKKIIVILILAFTLMSCATTYNVITNKSSKDLIEITSMPDSAFVYINREYIGRTPCSMYLQHTMRDIDVKVNNTKVNIVKEVNPYVLLNILFPLGFVIDVLTGEIIYYEVTKYHIIL